MADKFLGGIKAGSTSLSVYFVVRKKADNTEVTGLVFNTAGNIASYCRQGAARAAITLATQTVTGAFSSGGFVEIDATNMPGLYRLDVPDAAVATGVDLVTISFVSTNNYTCHIQYNLTTEVIQSGDGYARLGAPAGASISADVAAIKSDTASVKTATNTGVAPGASGGLMISGTNAGTTTLGALTVSGATTLTGNVGMAAGLTITQSTTNGHGISVTGNGTGNGILSTSGAGATGDGVRCVAGSTNGNGLTLVKTGSGNDLNATSTPLTPASVVGAVGSVTGNVGGNVTGSVGSVATGGIGSAALATAAINAIADGVLDRNMNAGTDSGTDSTTTRTPRQALRVLRNKTTIAAGVATVTKEDDATASWTAAITTTAGNPISGVDPT